MERIFILGADDPEMREIDRILMAAGEEVLYAGKGGARVHPGGAYNADPVVVSLDVLRVLVECEPRGFEFVNWKRIDHHRPGDPGYGLNAALFWEASSLGQLCKMLAIEPSHEQMILAAMDHCPANAIRGECPGVDGSEVMALKIQEVAIQNNVSGTAVFMKVGDAQMRLKNAASVEIGGQTVKDVRDYDTGIGYSVDYLASQIGFLRQARRLYFRRAIVKAARGNGR